MRWVLLVGLLVGCSVDDGFLNRDLFPCEGPGDCGDGWGCVRASPYATDFCAQNCEDLSCDGICTVQFGQALCLRGCRFDPEGNPSACPGDGFSCIRSSAETDEGVCYPVTSCQSGADCAPDELCLSELVGVATSSPEANGYYCVPRPSEGMCPARSNPLAIDAAGNELCVATCAPPDTRCPPGFGCLLQSAVFAEAGTDVLCFPGLYGVACDDDTNCLLGRCLDTGDAGKQCTLSCDEANRLAGGCGNLSSLANAVDALGFECDPAANEGEDGGLCVTRSGVGFLCTTPESNAYVCENDLECRSFAFDGGIVRLCTRACLVDQQCNRFGEDVNYCEITVRGGICLPKGLGGAACDEDNQCRSGRCRGNECTNEPL
ncbi:MAG: hypothetical protein AAGE52_07140 [Myxococcota bacterium]